mgnify:CR=1 FL=1
MKYVFLIMQPFSAAIVNVMQKQYKTETAANIAADGVYVLISMVVSLVLYGSLERWKIAFEPYTALYALALAVLAILSSFVQLAAMGRTSVINITVSNNSGAIIIPVLYGVLFLNEKVSAFKAAVILLVWAVCVPLKDAGRLVRRREKSGAAAILCVVLFVISGLVTVLYKIYASDSRVLSENMFCFWANVIMVPMLLGTIFFQNRRNEIADGLKKIKGKAYILAFMSCLFNGAVPLLSMAALKEINMGLYTVVSNSFLLIFAVLMSGIMLKEHINKSAVLSVALSLSAVMLNIMG